MKNKAQDSSLFAALLGDELKQRRRRNTRYSLRSFARDLGLSPSYLSQSLQGTRVPAEDTVKRIARQLRWNEQKRERLLLAGRLAKTKSHESRSELQQNLESLPATDEDFERVDLERFRLIAEPHHFAILELSELADCRNDPEWVAKRLGLTTEQAAEAIARLTFLGLLKIKGRGMKKAGNFRVADTPAEVIRQFHRATLQQAISAIEAQSFQERHLSAITMAIDPEQWPAALARITKFRREMMKLLERGNKKKVYTLSVQLFRLDQAHADKEEKDR